MDDGRTPKTEFELVMPFVAVVSRGGPYGDASYVAGYEAGRLDEYLRTLEEDLPGDHLVHTRNADQIDLIAMRHGFTVEFEDSGILGWFYASFESTD